MISGHQKLKPLSHPKFTSNFNLHNFQFDTSTSIQLMCLSLVKSAAIISPRIGMKTRRFVVILNFPLVNDFKTMNHRLFEQHGSAMCSTTNLVPRCLPPKASAKQHKKKRRERFPLSLSLWSRETRSRWYV